MEIEYDSQKQFDIYALVFYVVQCLIEVYICVDSLRFLSTPWLL